MRKIRMEKGITLVALIITIIILLILAVVTIGSMKQSNIITYAQNAANGYKENAEKENTLIDGYEALIEESISKNKSEQTVSIVGIYGDIDKDYYEFNADGTGKKYFCSNNGTNTSFITLFNYTMQNNEKGTITIIETGKKETFVFKYIKDNDNKLINKIVTVTNNNSGTVGSYTTAGNTGFTEISSDIIYENVKHTVVQGDVFYTISFKDGKCIAKLEKDGTIDDWGYYYKDGDYIYLQAYLGKEKSNGFVREFKVNGNELEYIE